VSNESDDTHAPPRTLAGATILQIVPALREEPSARAALTVAAALLQSGARALVAAEDGPLAAELKAFGGEWVPLVNATANPLKLRRSAHALEKLIASERVDIVHAQSVGGAWIASMAAAQVAVWLVTTLPDVPATSGISAYWAGALARGDRVITPSNFAAAPMIARYALTPDRITVIPREIDMAAFDPATVDRERVEPLRKTWKIPDDARILLVPGRVAPWNGQLMLPDVARALVDDGAHGFVFVLAGEHRTHGKYARFVADEARAKGVQACIRLTGHCRDMPAAFAAADTVVVLAIGPRASGGASAGHGAAGRHLRPWDFAGACSGAAGNAGECAHGMGGKGRRRDGIRSRDQRRAFPRRSRLPHDGGARTTIRRIHVRPAERCRRDQRGLHVAARARRLVWRI
jgi:hypothetical protein